MGILGDLCGDEDDLKCTKLVVTSDGPSAVMQGTRWFLLKSKIQSPGWACISCGGGINMTRLTNIQATSDRCHNNTYTSCMKSTGETDQDLRALGSTGTHTTGG